MSKQAPRKPFRLTHAALVKRHVGALQDTRCIAISFAVAHEQNRHVAYLAAFMCCGEPKRKRTPFHFCCGSFATFPPSWRVGFGPASVRVGGRKHPRGKGRARHVNTLAAPLSRQPS